MIAEVASRGGVRVAVCDGFTIGVGAGTDSSQMHPTNVATAAIATTAIKSIATFFFISFQLALSLLTLYTSKPQPPRNEFQDIRASVLCSSCSFSLINPFY